MVFGGGELCGELLVSETNSQEGFTNPGFLWKQGGTCHQAFQVIQNGGPHLYKLYGYGLCTGKPIHKMAL